jgi:hypothetical protein
LSWREASRTPESRITCFTAGSVMPMSMIMIVMTIRISVSV